MVEISPEIKEIVERNVIALATSDERGMPNVIPVACVKVVSKNQLLITDNYMVQTRKNLQKNKNVCLAVWDSKGGYKLIGKAEYFSDGEWKSKVKNLSENKGMPAKGAIVVTISKIIKLS